jgi:hypothetical protein
MELTPNQVRCLGTLDEYVEKHGIVKGIYQVQRSKW